MPRFTALLLTLGSAALYAACFPNAGLWWLAWVAQVPFFVALRRSRAGFALFLGWLFAVSVAYITGDWFAPAVAGYFGQPAWVGVGFFFGVSSLMAAPYVMAFSWAYQRLATRFIVALPLLTAAAWVAAELVRSSLFTGCPWAVFGYALADQTTLIQVADVAGVYGVSFLLVAVNVGLAELWLNPGRRSLIGLALTALVFATALAYGSAKLSNTPAQSDTASAHTVAIVQGNVNVGSQWRSDFYGRNLEAYLDLTRQALQRSPAGVVFWPESAMTFFLAEEPTYRHAIAATLQPKQAQLVAGGPRSNEPSATEPGYFNTVFLLSPDGEIVSHYDKQQLLPFAEYFPLRRLDFLRRKFERVREFTPGAPSTPLPTIAGQAGVIVCNEAMFPAPASARVADGASYLLNPSNDSWLGDEKFSAQVFQMVRFRAVEQRRYLVRTSTSGPSAIVDPYGRVLVQTEPFTAGWISGTFQPLTGTTWYHHLGDLFAVTALLASVAGVLATFAVARPFIAPAPP